MRINFVSYLACPTCQSSLAFIGKEQVIDGYIEEGALACHHCSRDYPIRVGIPRFPIDDKPNTRAEILRTLRTYNFTWRHFGLKELPQGWEKASYRYVDEISKSLISGNAKVGLEADYGGCVDLVRIATDEATVVGIDIGDG